MTRTLLTLAALSCSIASASDIIMIDFLPDAITTTAGSTVTFAAVLTNTTTSEVFLNSLNVEGLPLDFFVDVSPFFSGPPSLLGSQATAPLPLFAITIPDGFAAGDFTGTAQILGGSGPSDGNVLEDSAVPFTVSVGTPEPATYALVGLALVVIGFRARPRSRRGGYFRSAGALWKPY